LVATPSGYIQGPRVRGYPTGLFPFTVFSQVMLVWEAFPEAFCLRGQTIEAETF